MSRYKTVEPKIMMMVDAEKVVPILPVPTFRSHTVHVRVIQGGFMDDSNRWYQAPKRIKEAVRINGIWYWAFRIRDNHGKMLISKDLLFPCV